MADPSTYRPAPGTIPDSPGVYRFHDGDGRVIYVGKAKSLRSRLSSYFADLSALHPRTRQMVTTATGVHWTVVNTEVEALQLEYSWIKEFDPRFNVRYRDDKSYPVLAVTLHEEFPRLHVYRGPRRKGVRYFGPYAHAWAIRDTLDTLLRVFPARTCSNNVFKRHAQMGRPCLLGYIDKCSAPCVGRVEADEHRRIVEEFCDFLTGRTDAITRRLRERMEQASEQLDFERAARLRDDLEALRRAMEKQAVVLGDGTDADVAAFAEDELAAAVQVFHVRGGRVRGQRGWVIDKAERTETPELVEQFLTQFYGEQAALADQADAGGTPVPREVLVPELPEDSEAVAQWLGRLRGSKVGLRVPQRGDKRTLLETVRANAQEAFKQYKLRRAGDINARSAALQELQESLGLDSAPLRIECVDVSHVQGSDVVASLVVFEDGVARKSEYRRFSVRGGGDGGDTAAMAEVVRRRFNRYLRETGAEQSERVPASSGEAGDAGAVAAAGTVVDAGTVAGGVSDGAEVGDGTGGSDGTGASVVLDSAGSEQPPGVDPETGRPRKFAYPPNLLVVDGGAPQVNAAADELAELGITDVAVIGLAKRLEEVWLPAEPEPLVLSRTSEALYLLQRVRDEAHRFAVAYHRKQRSKRMTDSELDAVPGLGQVKKKALLKHFGSLRKIRAATIEEISAVPGFGRRTAEAVHGALSGAAGTGAASDAAGSDAAESNTAGADVAGSDVSGAETAANEATGTGSTGKVDEPSDLDGSQGRNISSTVAEPTDGVRRSESDATRDGDGTAGG
ncbi:Excinuclease ABC subunit C [Actinopolyspora lacussalsi subsp. righensis]|uniref:UvrABC system protein C n=1 Tax=Actinopolyspora righensis TaxID=995060 RepID=A0A1I7CD03_9ACTN|nr:excinuclease ABC subunit UvrC [Actinopolyspora righensis]SFT97254.1 Excinuclease ABC subunit C [Actinopolyspora righensis]